MKVKPTSEAGLQDVLQGTFHALVTDGDGACAIHAVFGVLNAAGTYKCPQARQLFCDSLGVAYADFEKKSVRC